MFFLRFLIPAAVSIFALTSHAFAQKVVVSETIQKYGIEGRNARQLAREMTLKGPPPAFGGPGYFARAEPDYSWYLSLKKEEGLCIIEGFEISVNVHYTIPHWANKEKAGKRLQKKWDRFIDALWIHEKGHGDIAVEDAVEVGKLIDEVQPAGECDDLTDQVSEVTTSYLKSSKRQRDYDKETQHGKTQGAYWEY